MWLYHSLLYIICQFLSLMHASLSNKSLICVKYVSKFIYLWWNTWMPCLVYFLCTLRCCNENDNKGVQRIFFKYTIKDAFDMTVTGVKSNLIVLNTYFQWFCHCRSLLLVNNPIVHHPDRLNTLTNHHLSHKKIRLTHNYLDIAWLDFSSSWWNSHVKELSKADCRW